MDGTSRPRPSGPRSRAEDSIESPTPQYAYERHTQIVDIHLPGTAQSQPYSNAGGAQGSILTTDCVRLTRDLRWSPMHPEHIQNVNTYEVPMGSTIEFRLAPAQQPAVQHASSSSSTSTSAPGPANPQPTVPAHQQTRYSGSQLHHQANYSGAAQGIAAGPDPTVHAGAPMSIDGPPDARDFPRGPARMGRTASTTTAPITPDVLRQGLWKLNGNEDASRDRNGEDGNEASIATRDWERREVPARYQERNPGYRPESSPSTASSPSSSSGTPIDSGKEPPRDDPPLNGVRIITEDGNTYYLMADTDARNGLEEYQRLHPDRKLPSHRTAKPGKSALRGAPQNQERDAAPPTAGGAPRPRQQRESGRHVADEDRFVPFVPPRSQQRTPPYDGDEEDEDESAPGWDERRDSEESPTSSESSDQPPPPAWWRPQAQGQTRRRRLPDPPVDPYPRAAGAHAGYYGGPMQGQPPPVMTHPFGHPGYGWVNCHVCQHPASHRLDCPVYVASHLAHATPNPPPPLGDPVGRRSASRATQREERKEHHNHSFEERHATHRARRHHGENVSSATAPPPPVAPLPRTPPPPTTHVAGQIGNFVEGSPARMNYWAAPPIARAQNTPAPDESPPAVIPSPPTQQRNWDPEPPVVPAQAPTPSVPVVPVVIRQQARIPPVVPPEPRSRRHRRDRVTHVPVIPDLTPDRTTINTQLDTPPPSRGPSPNTPRGQFRHHPPAQQPVPAVWAQPFMPAGFSFPAVYPAIAWVPHPRPHPNIPAATFWQLPYAVPSMQTPAVASMTGGWPLPGTIPGVWQTPAWPPPTALAPTPARGASLLPVPTPVGTTPQLIPDPNGPRPILCPILIPNPGNATVPWLDWDIRMPPSMAKRITAREVVVRNIRDKLKEVATHPPTSRVTIAYNTAVPELLNHWGPIVVDKGEGGTVTVGDILDAVFDFFQVPLTYAEGYELPREHSAEFSRMSLAFHKRCRDYPAIPEKTYEGGMLRVDALTDRYKWWGMWVQWNPDGSWYLNLGTDLKRRPR